MATINLIASAAPITTPISWGDNTIVSNPRTSFYDNPQWTGLSDVYKFTRLDFTTDTFPQFKASNQNRSLRFIKITEIQLMPLVNITKNGNPLLVDDIVDIDNDELLIRNSVNPINGGMGFCYFKYINSEDGINYNPQVESKMNIIVFPIRLALNTSFSVNQNIEVPKNTIHSLTLNDFTTQFGFISIVNYQFWETFYGDNMALMQYLQDTEQTKPYKIQVMVDLDPRITFLNERVVAHQRLPINLIQSGFLKINTIGLTATIEIPFRFGDSYYGSFRLVPN